MKQLSTSPILRAGALLLICAAMIMPAQRAAAQTNVLCFTQPGITNCLGGRFLQYWQQNGGLPVFGYPITAQGQEQTSEGPRTTQYLERQRFELSSNPAPYDVLLGRLGDELLRRQGIDWNTLPKAPPNSPNYFPQTGHSVPQQFYDYWLRNGLRDPALNSYQQSLALFGLPLTEAFTATNSSGDTVLTQWFERARFEFHPNNPPQFQVLLGLLGNEIRATPPPPPPPAINIAITSPAAGATVSNPFTATGTTNFVPNDNVLNYQVFDAGNNLIGQAAFGVNPSGGGSQWSTQVSFTSPANAQPIRLVIIAPSAEGPPEATASINLNVSGPQQQSIRIDEPVRDQVYNRSPIRARGATTAYPQRNVLHFVIYRAGGGKVGEGDFPVSASGSGSTFDHTLNFTAPSEATYLELEISDRDVNGNTITQSNVRVYFDPGGSPPPSGQTLTITSPTPGTLIARNFQAFGTTTQYPPNGVLNYGVLDNVGQLIGQGSIFVEPTQNGGTWAAEISFNGGNQGTPVTLEVVQPGGGPGQPPVARVSVQLQCCQ